MSIQNALKTSVAVGALLAFTAPITTAGAGGIKNQNGKLNLTVGGQIVRALLYADDGEHSQTFHTDGISTGTRIRFIPTGQLTDTIKVGALLEFDVANSNDPSGIDLGPNGDTVGTGGSAVGERIADIAFSHKSMGKLSIGRGNTASNGASEVSMSGTGAIVGGPANVGGALMLYNNTTKAYSALTVGAQGSTFDGNSRASRVRYDLPKFAGFSTAVSWADDGAWDFGARYSAKYGDVKAKFGAHYMDESGATGISTHGISGGLEHVSGLNVNMVYAGAIYADGADGNLNGGNDNSDGRDANTWKFGLGYKAKLTALGQTNFAVEIWEAEDSTNVSYDLDTWQLMAVQNLDSIGSTLGLSYHHYEFSDGTTTDYNDIDVVYFMTQLKF